MDSAPLSQGSVSEEAHSVREQYHDGYNADSSYVDLKDSALLLQGSVCKEAHSGERAIPRWL